MDFVWIQSADGPTAIFLAGTVEDFNWLVIFGIGSLLLLFIPNMAAVLRGKERNLCENPLMNTLERISFLFCLLFMFVWTGEGSWGFASVGGFLCYLFGNILLILVNWIVWGIFYLVSRPKVVMDAWADGPTAVFIAGKKPVQGIKALRLAMAVVPVLLFFLDGITTQHWLLVISAVVYGVSHIYVAFANIKQRIGRT